MHRHPCHQWLIRAPNPHQGKADYGSTRRHPTTSPAPAPNRPSLSPDSTADTYLCCEAAPIGIVQGPAMASPGYCSPNTFRSCGSFPLGDVRAVTRPPAAFRQTSWSRLGPHDFYVSARRAEHSLTFNWHLASHALWLCGCSGATYPPRQRPRQARPRQLLIIAAPAWPAIPSLQVCRTAPAAWSPAPATGLLGQGMGPSASRILPAREGPCALSNEAPQHPGKSPRLVQFADCSL